MGGTGNSDYLDQESVSAILELTRKLASHFDIRSMLAEVVGIGMNLLHAEKGTLWLYEKSSGELVCSFPELPLRVPEGDGLVGACASERRIINVLDAAADPRYRGHVYDTSGFVTRSMLCVPVIAREGALIGVLQFLDEQVEGYDHRSELLAAALAAQCAVALQHTQLNARVRQSEILQNEVEVAREIQTSMLPSTMPYIPGYEVYGHFQPATYAGGDLFDLVMLDEQLFLLLGDATGHGFGPALSAVQMQAMLRVAFRCGASLEEAYRHVNNQLVEDLPDDRFITAFMGFLDPRTHQLRYHSGGQGPIAHLHGASGQIDWHQPTSFPVGVMEIESAGEAQLLALQPGDILAVLSDGVYEYANTRSEHFGEARVATILAAGAQQSMAGLCRALLDATIEFGEGAAQADDITMVLLRRLPMVDAPAASE